MRSNNSSGEICSHELATGTHLRGRTDRSPRSHASRAFTPRARRAVICRRSSLLVGVFAAAPLLIVLAAAPCAAAQQRTYANPIDIDYRYNFEQLNQGISYRSGADPVIVVQGGKYYLFETIGDGYWESTDLGTWRHITPSRWPLTDVVAPAVLSVRDTIYLLPSTTSPLPILMLTEPASGRVEF